MNGVEERGSAAQAGRPPLSALELRERSSMHAAKQRRGGASTGSAPAARCDQRSRDKVGLTSVLYAHCYESAERINMPLPRTIFALRTASTMYETLDTHEVIRSS